MSNVERFSLAAALAALLAACDTTGPADRSFDIELETSHTMAQGDIVEIPVTIHRNNFDGPITFSVQQAPPGISASFSPAVATSDITQTTLVIETAGEANPGTVAITVAANGEGAPARTRTVDIAIHLRGSYALELLDSRVTVAQGGRGSAGVIFRRFNANASGISLAVSGLPAGVTTSSTETTSGPGTSISLHATMNAAVGTHAVTITSSAPGTPAQTATLSLVVIAPPGTSNVSISYCFTPLWFAYQNEGYGWQTLPPGGRTFSFAATERFGIAVAFALTDNGSEFNVTYHTREELSHRRIACAGSTTVTGTVAGLASGQQARVAIARSSAIVSSGSPGFTLTNLREGSFDLVAARGTVASGGVFQPDRFMLRRGVEATPGALPPLDFEPEGFAPVASTLSVSGLAPDERVDWDLQFLAAGETSLGLHGGANAQLPTTTYMFPASVLQPGDVHHLVIGVQTTESGPFRWRARAQDRYFGAPSGQSVVVPPPLSNSQIALAAALPYPRLRARFASQPSYDGVAMAGFYQYPGLTRRMFLRVSAAYLGSTPPTWDLVVPDFGGVSGLNPAWLFESVDEYFVEAFSSPALFFGARPKAGDTQRWAFDWREISGGGSGGKAAQGAAREPRQRSMASDPLPWRRMR